MPTNDMGEMSSCPHIFDHLVHLKYPYYGILWNYYIMTKFFFFPCGSLSPENTPEQRWLQVLSSPEAPCDASTCAS